MSCCVFPACSYYFLIDVDTCKTLIEIKENRKQPIHPLVDLKLLLSDNVNMMSKMNAELLIYLMSTLILCFKTVDSC